jgi:hypothetical protein
MHTMSVQKESKLRNLLKLWPMHTALPVAWLKTKGFSKSLIQRYVSSGWLEYLDRGVVVRPGDSIDWSGMLWGLQQLCQFHVGGKTALELQGKAHFIKFQENEIYVFSHRGFKFPKWMEKNKQKFEFINTPANLFLSQVGLKIFDFGEFQLQISNPARAFCEYMYVAEKFHSYDESYYIMENLHLLSSDLMQEALEECTSVKIKRLVLCLAKIQNVSWYQNLDKSKFELGSGARKEVKNGIYEPEFLITYPRVWNKAEDESVF